MEEIPNEIRRMYLTKYFYKYAQKIQKQPPSSPPPTLNETHLDAVRGEGARLTKRFQPAHQQEELVGVMQLRLSRTNRF